MKRTFYFLLLINAITFSSCSQDNYDYDILREDKIPADAVKMNPVDDLYSPVMQSPLWNAPEPMTGPINTAGAEDSPYISKDGNRFFFFFTPDVNVPLEKQLIDTVTGIWWSEKEGGEWCEPKRIYLQSIECLDGCAFSEGDTLYFGSVRKENLGEIDIYKATYDGEEWGSVKNCGEALNVTYDIGEFHITDDGQKMYYGKYIGDNYDIYSLTNVNGEWTNETAVDEVNTEKSENQPFITHDGNEMWFTSESRLGFTGPAVYRSVKTDSGWREPEEIVSNFAGEPCLDSDGNIYFVHHYMDSSVNIIEADIYVCRKK